MRPHRAAPLFLLAALQLAACGGAERPVDRPPVDEAAPPAVEPDGSALDVDFVINPGFDLTRIFGILHQHDPAGLESRAESMDIGIEFARRIHDAEDLAEVELYIREEVDARHEALGPQLEVARVEYETIWKELGGPLSAVVQEIVGEPWFHERYVCVVSAFHKGLSDWHGNRVAAGWDLPAEHKARIVSHEIVLSHVFQTVRQRYTPDDLEDWRVWAFSEITAVFVLDHETLRERWPGFPRAGEYFAESNYPQLAELEPWLKELYDEREDFGFYLDSAVPMLRDFRQTHLEVEEEKPADRLEIRPVLLVADNQLNNLATAPAFIRSSVADRFKGVSIRPPMLDLFARDVFCWAVRELGADRFVLHLGDALNISCTSEWRLFVEMMRDVASNPGWVMVPGNHDAYYYGNTGGGHKWLSRLASMAEADVPTLWDRACSDEYPPRRRPGLRFTKNRMIDSYVAELKRRANRDAWLGGSKALDRCLGKIAARRTCEYLAEDPTRILRRVLIHKFPEAEQHQSFVLQELELDINAEPPVRAILLDTVDYPANPAMIGGAIDRLAETACGVMGLLPGVPGTESIWSKPYAALCHLAQQVESFNPGLTGNLSAAQIEAADRWLAELPAEGRYILVGHHPAKHLLPPSLAWLETRARDDPRFVMYVSAHSHDGKIVRHEKEGGARFIEVNVGSTTDWPAEVRELVLPPDRETAWALSGPRPGITVPAGEFPGLLALEVEEIRARKGWPAEARRRDVEEGTMFTPEADNNGCLERFRKTDYTGYQERSAWLDSAEAAHNATLDILLLTYRRMFEDLRVLDREDVEEGRRSLVDLAIRRADELIAQKCGDTPDRAGERCRASKQRQVDWLAELDRRLRESPAYSEQREAYGVCQGLWASEAEGPQGARY